MLDHRSQHIGWIEQLLNMLEEMDWRTKDFIKFKCNLIGLELFKLPSLFEEQNWFSIC